MRTSRSRSFSSVSLLAGLAIAASAASAQTARYTVTDLGALPASSICPCFFAGSISENGIITGDYFGPHDEHRGFIWQNGLLSDIGGAPGAPHTALGVNNDGVSVGFGAALAFRAQNGVVTDLPTLGGPFADARAINNNGVIVGTAVTSAATGSLQRAARWIGASVLDLGTLGGEFSQASGVNDAGQVVGWAWNPARRQIAFVWTPGAGMTGLPSPAGGNTASFASSINDAGVIVGTAEVFVGSGPQDQVRMFRAFRWTNGVGIDLGDLADPAVNSLGAGAINNHGQIVGTASRYPDDVDRPFLWENGTMVDVNSLIDPASGWRIITAADINDAGQIAASGLHADGRRHALLLTPIPACPADFDHDGVLNSQDFFTFLQAFFNNAPAADFNHSGAVDSQDFFEYVTAFFSAPGC